MHTFTETEAVKVQSLRQMQRKRDSEKETETEQGRYSKFISPYIKQKKKSSLMTLYGHTNRWGKQTAGQDQQRKETGSEIYLRESRHHINFGLIFSMIFRVDVF